MSDTPRDRWLAGYCPCCGDIELDNDHVQPVWIGEGVRMCGDCVRRGHDDDDTVALLLETIVTGADP